MYIPEFWCGVVCTILSEVLGVVAYAIYCNVKAGKKK